MGDVVDVTHEQAETGESQSQRYRHRKRRHLLLAIAVGTYRRKEAQAVDERGDVGRQHRLHQVVADERPEDPGRVLGTGQLEHHHRHRDLTRSRTLNSRTLPVI